MSGFYTPNTHPLTTALPQIHPTARVDETVRVYGRTDLLTVGAGSRIDAYCVITVGERGVTIGEKVHVSAGVYIFGGGGRVQVGKGCFLSPRATLFTATDDMEILAPVGPLAAGDERAVTEGDVVLMEHSGVGAGGIVFPGVTLYPYAVVGALSIAKWDVPEGTVVVGPDKFRFPRIER